MYQQQLQSVRVQQTEVAGMQSVMAADPNMVMNTESIFADLLKHDEAPKEVRVVKTNAEKVSMFEQLFNPYLEKKPIKVAEITFAYNNHEMIKLLQERGTYIKRERWAKYRAVEGKIEKYLGKPANCQKLVQPVCAFIVFESALGKKIAIEYSQKVQSNKIAVSFDLPQETIFNETPQFKVATNPTNIIWENRHIKGSR